MIIFKHIKWKNFLSTGDNFTELSLNENPHTLIVGSNGSGKSTFLDAVSFALFGKPHRKINKASIVNSINKKNCVVEIEFDIGKSSYKIVRGISPNIFEVYVNGEMIDQTSQSKEYQAILEKNILKLNHKSFHQIVVLGSSSFVPFMQLPTLQRREIIEDLLDISVFSKMNNIIKEERSKLKHQTINLEHDLDMADTKIASGIKHINDIKELNESQRSDKINKINSIKSEIEEMTESAKDLVDIDVTELSNEIKEIDDKNPALHDEVAVIDESIGVIQKDTAEHNQAISTMVSERNSLNTDNSVITSKLKDLKVSMEFYENNDTCSVCQQDITPENKAKYVKEIKEKADALFADKEANDTKIKDIDANIDTRKKSIEALESDINIKKDLIKEKNALIGENLNKVRAKTEEFNRAKALNAKNAEVYNNIKRLEDRKTDLEEEISSLDKSTYKVKDLEDALETNKKNKVKLEGEMKILTEEYKYVQVITDLLKDDGIKTKVIKQYVPAINKLINKYLEALDFFVSFKLDDSFNEEIKSRHLDKFSYESFSEGEKTKIDLALLFTWRNIASMKNSVSTNLLILDETFDSSLDVDSVENLSTLLHKEDGESNTFIITHKMELKDMFSNILEFQKRNNFSSYKIL